jgi:hypothetical protein
MFINVGTCGFDLNQRSGSELTGAIAEAKAKAYPLFEEKRTRAGSYQPPLAHKSASRGSLYVVHRGARDPTLASSGSSQVENFFRSSV